MILALLRLLYMSSVILLTAYAVGAVVLLIAYLRHSVPTELSPKTATENTIFPSVCVQLPVFNEPFVVERLIDAAAHLDYPPEKLSIQVLDDSDDETTPCAAERVDYWAAQGVQITHIRRPKRTGFKAGALAHGLELTDADLIAVFDADFVPPPDFLQRVVGQFSDHRKSVWCKRDGDTLTLTRTI